MENKDTERRIMDNLGLVSKESWKYAVKFAHGREAIESTQNELFNEGVVGLCVANERYDPSFGTKFSTYAVWWIKKFIFEYLNRFYGHTMLPFNSADADGSSDGVLDEKYDCGNDDVTEAESPMVPSTPRNPFAVEDMTEMVKSLISILTDRERYIITKHFGLDGETPMTFGEIGENLGITGQRVFSIEKRAMAKMRGAQPKEDVMELLADLNDTGSFY